ncbi:DMT family transporter [Tabrizicola caldifontis]|uniref:DMT family transporter n=1 Tax=Tabrizicola caldifontis TaxID=2528036 RepID=UPI0010810514|nr:DMT family transporter [Rhodobacter sp. YIM 73028]
MMALSQRNPQAFGVLVTLAGVMIFVPDALLMRLIGGDMLALAVWRGLLAGGVLILGNLLLAPATLPQRGEWFDRKGLLIIGLNAAGVLSWCSAMQYTSAANALLVLAIAPFLAALLSYVLLKERIDRATGLAIALVFAGVLIIASGSLGHGRLLGDAFALLNAFTIAGYYVTLRTTGRRNMLPHLALGSTLGGLLALPVADFEPVTGTQALLILLSGAVILPGAVGLLILGPRYLPAPEVTMITLLEVILGPLLVWAVIGENPGQLTLIGGAVIVATVVLHAMRRLSLVESPG